MQVHIIFNNFIFTFLDLLKYIIIMISLEDISMLLRDCALLKIFRLTSASRWKKKEKKSANVMIGFGHSHHAVAQEKV